jgi:hypothetical protein
MWRRLSRGPRTGSRCRHLSLRKAQVPTFFRGRRLTWQLAGWPTSKTGCPIFATVSSSLIGVPASFDGASSLGIIHYQTARPLGPDFWLSNYYGLTEATMSCEDATLAVPMVKVVAPEPSGITRSFPCISRKREAPPNVKIEVITIPVTIRPT